MQCNIFGKHRAPFFDHIQNIIVNGRRSTLIFVTFVIGIEGAEVNSIPADFIVQRFKIFRELIVGQILNAGSSGSVFFGRLNPRIVNCQFLKVRKHCNRHL